MGGFKQKRTCWSRFNLMEQASNSKL